MFIIFITCLLKNVLINIMGFFWFQYVTSPNVMAMVEFFNRVALLAASEILSQDTPSGRARTISKVIQVSKILQYVVVLRSGTAKIAETACLV